jgi:hypothetical protein
MGVKELILRTIKNCDGLADDVALMLHSAAVDNCFGSSQRRYAVYGLFYLPKSLASDDRLWVAVLDPSPIAGLPVSASQVSASSDAVRVSPLIL